MDEVSAKSSEEDEQRKFSVRFVVKMNGVNMETLSRMLLMLRFKDITAR